MDSIENVEVLGRAIEKLLDDKRKREADGDSFIQDDDDHLLLSTFISQLETSPKSKRKTYETSKGKEDKYKESGDSSPSKDQVHLEKSVDEIAKDIKKMKRQNTITQLLLSAMILLTLTWQLSEYSLINTMKERLSHPIRSIGGLLSGMFKRKIRPIEDQLHGNSTSEEQDNLNNGNNGTHLQMPEIIREFGFNNDED